MHNKRSAKIILSLVLSVLSILSITSFAADPSFNITPIYGTQLKLYCEYNFGVVINPGGQSYNGFESTIKFNSGNVHISHQSIDPFFTSTTSWFIKDWYLYRAYGVRPGGAGSSTLVAASFLFHTTQNILSEFLEFTTNTWWPIEFDINTTDDGAVINSSVSSLDILSGVTNAWYTFVPLPCIIDQEPPLMMSPNPVNNARYITTGTMVSFILYDRAGVWIASGIPPMTNTNNRSHYRYSGLNIYDLDNYQIAPSTVDNQEWVNSGTINVHISCPTCSWWWAYTLTAADLYITTWWGDSSINWYTWNSRDRWYTVSFAAPTPYGYEVEKKVTMTIIWSDNPNELSNTHTGNFVIVFNAPVNPVITMTSPNDGATFVRTKFSPIVFILTDDRAGIDTWSINITVPAMYSWLDILYTGKTYSGTDLTITLISGQPGLGNSWSYQVSFVPSRYFPNNTWIHITGYVKDLANNETTDSRQFTTRPNCAFFWCSDVLEVNIFEGLFSWNFDFSGSFIQVIGADINSSYPYLTWVDNTILMCGQPYTGTMLTWNIWIYDTTGTQINWTIFTGDSLYITWVIWIYDTVGAQINWTIFNGDSLYITWTSGLDFIISGNVIIIQ